MFEFRYEAPCWLEARKFDAVRRGICGLEDTGPLTMSRIGHFAAYDSGIEQGLSNG